MQSKCPLSVVDAGGRRFPHLFPQIVRRSRILSATPSGPYHSSERRPSTEAKTIQPNGRWPRRCKMERR